MRQPITLLVVALSFFLFDPRLFRRRQSLFVQREGVSTVWDQERTKKKEKKKRKYQNQKFKKRKSYREKNYRLRNTKSKDHRYSNQRSLRRMYTNC